MRINTFFLVSALVLVIGCAKEADIAVEPTGEVQRVTVLGPSPIQFEAITGSPETKGTSIQDGSALLFNWAQGDTLGIFPNKGNQVEFPISASEGSTSASFDGGGWALRNNASYAAYYPFSVWNYHRDNETIVLDYSGQEQDGNGSFAHLSKYDFLASNKTTPQNSAVTFQMERQGSILYIDIVVPEPETITSLTISCDEAIFVEKASLNISGETPVVTPIKTTESLTLSFKNTVTTSNNETVRAYMAVQPVDFTQKTVTATLTTESGSYTAPVTSRVVNKGRAAFLRFSDDFTPVNIEFADAEVKRICVENWDTNGDGELSYKEAAAVTNIGTVFEGKMSVSSFKELEYFTGLTAIPDFAFSNTSFSSIVIPANVSSIGYCSFSCANIRSIHIPDGIEYIGVGAFYQCWRLESFTGKFASGDGHSLVKEGQLIASATAGLVEYTIPSYVTTISRYSIAGQSALCSIVFPDGLRSIEEGAFFLMNTNIERIDLPDSLLNLSTGNFTDCQHLCQFSGKFATTDGRALAVNGIMIAFAPSGITEYSIPQEVSVIGWNTFAYSSGISAIYVSDQVTKIEGYAFKNASLSQIELSNTLAVIDVGAFENCSNITEIIIPSSVETIGQHAFKGCTGLAQVEVDRVTPCSLGDFAFDATNDCPICVPNESVDAYKAAPGWSEYADRIVGIDVEGTVVGPEPQNPD